MGHGPARLFWVSHHRRPPEVRFPDGAVIGDLRTVHLPPANLPSRTPRDSAPAAVLVDLSDVATLDAAVRRIARVSRAIPAPVIALGGPREAAFHLEAALAGAVACLPAEPAPAELGTHLLLAIEEYLIRRELRRSHAAFNSILEDLDFGVLVLAMDGTIEKANRAMREILDIRAASLDGQNLADLTDPADHDTLSLFRQLAAGERDHYAVRQRFRTAHGRTVWLDLSASRIDEPALGEPFCVMQLVVADREVQTRSLLAESHRQYRSLFQSNPVPTYVVDATTLDILDANPAASEALGHPREELLRLGPAPLWTQSDRVDLIPDMLSEGADIGPVRVRQRHQDGSVVEGELESVRLEYGGRSAYLVTVCSVGEQLRREEDLDRAREAVTTRDVKREVSTSLAPLIERLELVLEDLGKAKGAPGQSSAESERLQGVLNEIRELTRRISAVGDSSHPKPAVEPTRSGILLVEDDPAVRFVICEMLEFHGHRVVEAESGQAALEAFGKEADIELIICDVGLRDMRGPKLVRKLRQRKPKLKILLISGYLDEALTARGILGHELSFLAKPFSSAELLAKVRALLDEPRPPDPDLAGNDGMS